MVQAKTNAPRLFLNSLKRTNAMKAKAKTAKHMDVAQDKKLISKMIKKSEKKDVKADTAMMKKAMKGKKSCR